jgi:hypothetical protein
VGPFPASDGGEEATPVDVSWWRIHWGWHDASANMFTVIAVVFHSGLHRFHLIDTDSML